MTLGGRSATIGLSVVSILLCAFIYAEISADPHGAASSPAGTRVAANPRSQVADSVAPLDHRVEWLTEITARPLFSPNRRPVETTVSGLPRLTGIVVAGSEKVAIFAAPNNEHPIVAHAGAHVGAYVVQTIGDDGVTVTGPAGTTLIRPIFDVAKPAGPAGTAAARAQPARPAAR